MVGEGNEITWSAKWTIFDSLRSHIGENGEPSILSKLSRISKSLRACKQKNSEKQLRFLTSAARSLDRSLRCRPPPHTHPICRVRVTILDTASMSSSRTDCPPSPNAGVPMDGGSAAKAPGTSFSSRSRGRRTPAAQTAPPAPEIQPVEIVVADSPSDSSVFSSREVSSHGWVNPLTSTIPSKRSGEKSLHAESAH